MQKIKIKFRAERAAIAALCAAAAFACLAPQAYAATSDEIAAELDVLNEDLASAEESLAQLTEELANEEGYDGALLEVTEATVARVKGRIEDKQAEYEAALAEEEEEARLEAERAEEEARRETELAAVTAPGSGLTGYEGWTREDAQMDVAQKFYSVLHAIGWSDTQIAGALGNIDVESGLDFSAVETVYTEPFTWGEKKRAAEAADYLMASYNPEYHNRFPKVYRCGLGLIQWSDTTDGATGDSGLRAYAAARGVNWYNLDIQLEYLLDPGEGYSTSHKILSPADYGGYASASVHEAATWWAQTVEQCTYDMDERLSRADKWYSLIGDMTCDEEYAARILTAAGVW